MNKVLRLILFLSFSGTLAASGPYSRLSGRSSPLERREASQEVSYGEENPSLKKVVPEQKSFTPNPGSFSIHADYLYWNSRLNGLDYASSGYSTKTIEGVNFAIPNGSAETYSLHSNWEPGVRVGLGIPLAHDRWTVGLDYTWFQASDHSQASGEVIPLWDIGSYRRFALFSDDNFLYEQAKASWNLRWNVVDLELGKGIDVSRYFRVSPYLGLKGYWGLQSFNTSFSGLVNGSLEEENPPLALQMKAQEKSWGVGVRAGFDSLWRFSENWGLAGTFALSGLWNELAVSRKDKEWTQADGEEIERMPVWVKGKYDALTPVLEISLGLELDTWLNRHRDHFGLRAAWELQGWFDMNQFLQLVNSDGSRGNLIFQGLTVEMRLDF